jgi:hypothetical protein
MLINGFLVNGQESRMGMKFEKQVSPKIYTAAKLETRDDIDGNLGFTGKSIFETDVYYKPIKNVSLGASFRYTAKIKIKDEDEQQEFISYEDKYRLTGDLKIKTNWLDSDIRFSNRLRYQYNISGKKDNQFIRNKVKCKYKLTKRVLPYLALESFYSVHNSNLQTLRLYLGSEFELIYNKVDAFFIFELNDEPDRYYTNQIIGFCYMF